MVLNSELLGKSANIFRQLKLLASNDQAVIVCDNVNFKDKKRDQVTGHTDTMRSMTMAAITLCSAEDFAG